MKSFFRRLDAFFESRSKNAILIIALIGALTVGALDYYTTFDILVVYLAPIFLASWYGGFKRGLAVAVYCGATVFVTESFIQQREFLDPSAVFSMAIRLLAYLLIALTVSRLRESVLQQKELVNFIVHDLRSPLSSSISGLLTLQQSGGSMNEHDKELVELALVSNERTLGLVNSMLDVAKLESGKMPVQKEEVDVDRFVRMCFKQVALWAKSANVKLAKEIHVEAWSFDTELTSRVLVNLLSNALKYSPDGGTVTVTATVSHHTLRLAIADQGPGIPPEFAESIFEPFAQAKDAKGGTGLGLTFCRLAVQAQGGRIRVESQPGKGTTMIFTLP